MLGKTSEAHEWLSRALSDAEPDGFVIPFAENYDRLQPILAREIKSGFIVKIIELGEAAKARKEKNTRPGAFGTLTQREFEIVNLIAQRLSNREIAERLFLSEGSVKQYVNQIYSKLHIEGEP
ncbi:MAG: response regulator transcription factor [Eubacteriales bacterium]